MRRRRANVLTLLSLVACAALAVLWVRSWGHVGSTHWVRPELTLEVKETDGVLGVLVARDSGLFAPTGGARLYGWFHWRIATQGRDRASYETLSFNRWGFGLHGVKTVGRPVGNWRFGGRRLWIVYVPYWLPVLLSAAVAAGVFVVRWTRSARRRRWGLCPRCGYDLRATPGRCPECGAVAAVG
jgi:hypothetical protein